DRSRVCSARVPSVAERVEHLTGAQKAKLAEELAELEGPRRAEVVQSIKTARSFGDLSENFEYHAAKNEQALLERRITILRSPRRRAAGPSAQHARRVPATTSASSSTAPKRSL